MLLRSAQLPTACRSMLMKAAQKSRPSPKATASLMSGKNFSVFSMYFGANSAPVVSLPTSLARSMIFSWPSLSKKPASPVFT